MIHKKSTTSIEGRDRNSSFELLRIIAMWMIVFYHFHTHVLQDISNEAIFRAIQIPIHIGVPVFILISGYFGIHTSLKGFSNLFVKTGFYSLMILLICFVLKHIYPDTFSVSLEQIYNGIFFISRTNNLWFIRSYIVLYLIAPYWNKVLTNQTQRDRIFLILILLFVSVYIGLLGRELTPEFSGKSLVNFLLIYTIGWSIKEYDIAKKLNIIRLVVLFLTVVSLVVFLYLFMFDNKILRAVVWEISFKYNSPILLLISILFFLIFVKFKLKNKAINYIASSAFAVYLISENSLVNVYLFDYIRDLYYNFSTPILYILMIIFTTTIFICCVFIDMITNPIQKFIIKKIEIYLGNICDKIPNKILK